MSKWWHPIPVGYSYFLISIQNANAALSLDFPCIQVTAPRSVLYWIYWLNCELSLQLLALLRKLKAEWLNTGPDLYKYTRYVNILFCFVFYSGAYITDISTRWPLGDVAVILKEYFSNSLYRTVAWALAVKLLSDECHRTSLMRSQHWFKWCFGAVRHQAITWANVDPDPCHHAYIALNVLITNCSPTNISNVGMAFLPYYHIDPS